MSVGTDPLVADLDSDHDGIPDETDLCPNAPEDHEQPEPSDGCPRPADRDHDGIAPAPDADLHVPPQHDPQPPFVGVETGRPAFLHASLRWTHTACAMMSRSSTLRACWLIAGSSSSRLSVIRSPYSAESALTTVEMK